MGAIKYPQGMYFDRTYSRIGVEFHVRKQA